MRMMRQLSVLGIRLTYVNLSINDAPMPEEDAEEDAKGLKQADYAKCLGTIFVLLSGLEKDDGDGVVEDGLSEDECVQLWFHLVCVEDGKNGDGVGGRQSSANRHGLDEVDLEAIER
jgi:hypothetical protein